MQNSDVPRSTQHPGQGPRVDAYGLFNLLVARLTDGVMRRLNPPPHGHDDKYQQSKQEQ